MKQIRVVGDQFTLVLVNAPTVVVDRASAAAARPAGCAARQCGMDSHAVVRLCKEQRLPLPAFVEETFNKCYGIGGYARRVGEWRITWQVSTTGERR